MMVLRSTAFFLLGMMAIFPLKAQVGKEMKAFRNNEGVTVTQLTPSLFNLYKKDQLSLGAEELLQQLKEINVLQLDRKLARPALINEISQRFNPLLENESKFMLVKSHHGFGSSERLYAGPVNGMMNTLVLWSETESEITVIELKGEISLEKVQQLPEILKIPGLEKLAYIHVDPPLQQTPADRDEIDGMMHELQKRFFSGRDSSLRNRLGATRGMFGDLDDLLKEMEEMFAGMEDSFNSMDFFGDLDEMSLDGSVSNGLEVIRENGKTRFKVNASNSDIYYLIDGRSFAVDSVEEIPEDIATIQMVSDPGNPRKSYVIINSLNKCGKFISYSDGMLTFDYEHQEYSFNLEKLPDGTLIVNNRIASRFNINPADIIQIRPATPLECELFRAPSAKVIIVTRQSGFFF